MTTQTPVAAPGTLAALLTMAGVTADGAIARETVLVGARVQLRTAAQQRIESAHLLIDGSANERFDAVTRLQAVISRYLLPVTVSCIHTGSRVIVDGHLTDTITPARYFVTWRGPARRR